MMKKNAQHTVEEASNTLDRGFWKGLIPAFSMALFASMLFFSCLLEKEPGVPSGFTNEEKPVFATTELLESTDSTIITEAKLSTLGNLNIRHHGWIWREDSLTGVPHFLPDLGELKTNVFTAQISGLKVGVVQSLQPYTVVGVDTIFGSVGCFFAGAGFEFNSFTRVFEGARVKFKNTSAGPVSELHWDFGDGDTSNLSKPMHIFQKSGKTTVQLIAKIGNCVSKKKIVFDVLPNVFNDYWVALPGGTFTMGCTPEQGGDCDPVPGIDISESPTHLVTLSPFAIGQTEITQAQWQAVMGNNPSFFQACGDDCPVENISWKEVKDGFLPRLDSMTGYVHTMPTEAQWEYAARGGGEQLTIQTKYSGSDVFSNVGWFGGNPLSQPGASTMPVKKFDPNAFGLYDMSGNVGEWCSNKFPELYPSDPQFDPMSGSVGGQQRVVRGFIGNGDLASLYAKFLLEEKKCRVSARDGSEPASRLPWVGFRVVRKL